MASLISHSTASTVSCRATGIGTECSIRNSCNPHRAFSSNAFSSNGYFQFPRKYATILISESPFVWCTNGSPREGKAISSVAQSTYVNRAPLGASAAATSVQHTQKSAESLVDDLLSLVEGTDRGATLGKEGHENVAKIICQLEQLCIPEPLKSPLIFGDWDVEYCSNPTASGGYYRSTIGRLLLRTKEMAQTIQSPDSVGNRVAFLALNAINGEVSLKGKLTPLDNKWIQITFDPPNLKLGSFEFQYGGESVVKIAIIYVDERVRLGRGSRGSLFVFKRRG